MATVYKVRQGESIFDVEGFAALVQLAQEGKLSPDDAVFVPASNRWHYARSIRQLREFFPAVEDPPPPPGKVREMPREQRSHPERSEGTNPQPDPTEATRVQDHGDGGSGNGADVVPLRRGRWSAEGKGVDVPVFNYEMDLEPPAAAKSLRLVVIAGASLVVAGGLYLYKVSYAQYIAEQNEKIEFDNRPVVDPAPVPSRTRVAVAATAVPEETQSVAVTEKTPPPTPTPVPLPSFDAEGARQKVLTATLTGVTRADQLANAIRSDLIKMAVPVRAVRLDSGKSKTKGPVPFDMVVEYSLGDEAGTHALHAKHYWMILSMAGRRANETKLNLRSVTIRSFRGNKLSSAAAIPADTAKGVASGSKSPDDVLPAFAELTKR